MRIQEDLDEQLLNRHGLGCQPGIARRFGAAEFQPVQRAFARQWRAISAPSGELGGKRSQHRVMPQLIVVIEVFVAKGNHHIRCITRVSTSCSINDGLGISLKQAASLRVSPITRLAAPSSGAPASEVIRPPSNDATTARPSTRANSNSSGLHSVGVGGLLRPAQNALSQKHFCRFGPPMYRPFVRNAG